MNSNPTVPKLDRKEQLLQAFIEKKKTDKSHSKLKEISKNTLSFYADQVHYREPTVDTRLNILPRDVYNDHNARK